MVARNRCGQPVGFQPCQMGLQPVADPRSGSNGAIDLFVSAEKRSPDPACDAGFRPGASHKGR